MGVMETIRKGTDSTLMKILFGVIVLVFVFWGVGTSQMGATSQIIAEVNGKRITDTEYHRVMRSASRGTSSLDEDQLNELGRQVITELIRKEVLLQEAERLDIEVSDEEIARYVLNFDDFKDSDGKFDRRLYERTLKRNGMTQGKFEAQIRQELTLQKLASLAAESVHVSDAEVRRRFMSDGTQVELRYVAVPDAALLDDVEVSDTDVQTLLASGDPRVQERYDADFDRLYNQPRKADFSVILLRADLPGAEEGQLRARMETIRDQAAAGADFATLARTWSEDLNAVNGGAFGMLAEPQMDPALARAIFEAEAGGLTEIVQTGRGFQLVQVHEVQDARVVTLEDVREQIAREILASDQVAATAGAYAERLLEAWKQAGEPPAELLAEQGLRVEETGPFAPALGEIPGLGASPALRAALEKAEGAGVLDGVYPAPGARVVAAVLSVEVPTEDEYQVNAETMQARLEAAAQDAFVQSWTEDLVARARVKQFYTP